MMTSSAVVQTQRCSRCRQEKEAHQFAVVIDGVRMNPSVCAPCVTPDFQRTCKQCGETQPLTAFDGCMVGLHRRMATCRTCCTG
jgi:hypothetical protein